MHKLLRNISKKKNTQISGGERGVSRYGEQLPDYEDLVHGHTHGEHVYPRC